MYLLNNNKPLSPGAYYFIKQINFNLVKYLFDKRILTAEISAVFFVKLIFIKKINIIKNENKLIYSIVC